MKIIGNKPRLCITGHRIEIPKRRDELVVILIWAKAMQTGIARINMD
ncbi:MAG: hypothetical protein ABI267_00675 [Ginsengibacter sp.]